MLPAMPEDKHRQTLVMCQVQLGDKKWNFLVCLCMPPRLSHGSSAINGIVSLEGWHH